MDFKLSEFSNSVQQPIGDPDVEKIVIDGEEMKAYVFKDKILMSPGVWNQWYYSPEEMHNAYNNTDWTNTSNLALFADHQDQNTSAWIGYVRNPKMAGDDQIGDLVLVDKDYAKKLILGAKFGVSPKLAGKGVDGTVKGASYKNFSVVVDPACKTTFLNQEDKEESTETVEPVIVDKEKPKTTEKEVDMEKTDKPQEKVEEKLEDKQPETKIEPTVDKSAELIAKLSETISAGFAKVTDKIDDMEKKTEVATPAEVKVKEPATVIPLGEPIRQTVKESELGTDNTQGSFLNTDAGMVKYLQNLGRGSETFELSLEADEDSGLPWMTFTLATTATVVTDVRGTSRTAYNLLPTQWAKSVVDGGKNLMFFSNVVRQATVPKGVNDYIMPIRNKYESSWETSAEEYAIDTNVLATVLDDMDGVQFTPTRYNYRVAITQKAVNTNAIDLMRYAREEMAYKWSNDVDAAVATALAAGTAAAVGVPGTADVYGGDATSLATLRAGDTLTTDMIAKAKRVLRSKYNYYWDGGTFTKDTDFKNPWENTTDSPYVLFVAPEQEEVLLTDSQFVNAAEYGGNEVVLNGEIGKYLGCKVVVSNNAPAYANFGAGAEDGHKCMLVKSQYCGGIAWGQKPSIKAFDWPIEDKKMIIMNMEYESKVLQKDAIVRLNVTDQ